MFCVSCLGIWWRHNIWISRKVKLIISRTKRAFLEKELFKKAFFCFPSTLFRSIARSERGFPILIRRFWCSLDKNLSSLTYDIEPNIPLKYGATRLQISTLEINQNIHESPWSAAVWEKRKKMPSTWNIL